MSFARLRLFHVTRTHVRLDAYAWMRRMLVTEAVTTMTTQPVWRIEAYGEAAVACRSLAEAMRIAPQSRESYIATSTNGVHLADAFPIAGEGSLLRWRLTRPGQDVLDHTGWTAGAPVLDAEECATVIELALREDLEAAS